MKLKIALAQMKIEDGEKEKNLRESLTLLEKMANADILPDIVVFPELFTTGFDLHNVKQYVEPIPGPTTEKIMEITKNKFVVIGSILEKEGDDYYNTAFIMGKDGNLIGKYRKTHLFGPMLEKDYLSPGNELKTFNLPELDDLKIGVAICYDLRFPEIFRKLTLEGAKLIFVPAEFPNPKRKTWKALIRARAIENQIIVVAVNRIGEGQQNSFFGYSMITDGETKEVLSDLPMVRTIEVELSVIDKIREKLPTLEDRREDLY